MKAKALAAATIWDRIWGSGVAVERPLIFCAALAIPWSPAIADEPPPLPRTLLGTVGLIEMPSARMAPDGQLSIGGGFMRNTQHYDADFEILPWLEGSFRYSGLTHFEPTFPVYWDRSFGVKVRLWNENDLFPAVALGINDLVGTGVYSSEYLVASKRFGDFDTTMGIGWGRFGETALFDNPIASLSKSFETRPGLTSPGGSDLSVFFHGQKSGLFGGVTWRTPLSGLSLIAEYSSDAYNFERTYGNFRPRNQMNYGASYQLTDNVVLGLNWLYGTSIGASIAVELDPKHPQYPAKVEPPLPPAPIRSPSVQQNALAIMLGHYGRQQGPTLTADRIQSANRNAFVDALYHTNDNFSDVAIHGTVLTLTMNYGVSLEACGAAAKDVQFFGREIEQVVLLQGQHRADCAVPRLSPIVYRKAIPSIDVPEADTGPLHSIEARDMKGSSGVDRSIRADAAKQNIDIEAIAITESEAIVYYYNGFYFSELDAVNRLSRILMENTPGSVEKFRLIAVVNGNPQREFDILRAPAERAVNENSQADILGAAGTQSFPPLQNPVLAAAKNLTYPRFYWDVFPQFRQSLFDPNLPFGVQLLAAIEGTVTLLPGLNLNAEVEKNIYADFAIRESDSLLPHVRSDFLKYFQQGKNGIGYLQADYSFRLTPNVFALVKAGYLESMFAGAGGEVLWRPEGQRWALGADLYDVQQRDFNRLFGLQNYHTFTGHISAYYDSPWYDLNFSLSAGQYLAGDRGVTFQATRQFMTGVEIGAFVTLTNVPAAQFGEGSFDKGIIIRIPLGWVTPIESQGTWALDLRPLQRDGGQRLSGDTTLYSTTSRTSQGAIMQQQDSALPE